MRLTRHFPEDYDSLRRLVQQATEGAQSVVMQAGHFLLYYDEQTGKIIPCLNERLTEERHLTIRRDYAQFPILTWQLGLRLLASIPATSKQVMVVVNDWQYVPVEANRSDFYAAHHELPESYSEELAQHSENVTIFQPKMKTASSTAPFFSEMNLRNRYQRHVSKLIAAGNLPPDAIVETGRNGVFCSLPDLAGAHTEVYCSKKTGDCAGEIAEMIHDAASRAGATCFINLYPVVCRKFVELGTKFSVDLLGSTCPTVLNLGFQSTAVQGIHELISTTEVTLHRWESVESARAQ